MIDVIPQFERLTYAPDMGDCLYRSQFLGDDERDLIEYMLVNEFKEARNAAHLEARVIRQDGPFYAIRLQMPFGSAILVYITFETPR